MSEIAGPGWQKDPYGRAEWRWWDGKAWTPNVSNGGVEALDPVVTAPSPPAGGAQPASYTTAATAPARRATMPWIVTALVVVAAVVIVFVERRDTSSKTAGSTGPTSGQSTGTTSKSTSGTTKTTGGSPTRPVGILSGLGSLDSYEYTLTINATGPTAQETQRETMQGSFDRKSKSSSRSTTTTSQAKGDEKPSTSTSQSWKTADETCAYDGDTYKRTAAAPATTDLFSLAGGGMIDITPVFGDPKKIADETLAGVAVAHYSFTMPGLGTIDGAQVSKNAGEYWVAKDGNYLVKYSFSIDMAVTPKAGGTPSVYKTDMALELTKINTPVTVTPPAGCAAAPLTSDSTTTNATTTTG